MLADISYTIDIEEIPERVKDLYEKDVLEKIRSGSHGGEVSKLNYYLEEIEGSLDNFDSPSAGVTHDPLTPINLSIEQIRGNLVKLSEEFSHIQIRIRDIDMILKGYQKYKLGLLEPPKQEPKEPG
jgi:hypothetical protein